MDVSVAYLLVCFSLLNFEIRSFLKKKQRKAVAENPKKLDALKASCAHVSEIAEYIKSKNICTVAVSDDDVNYILDLAWKRSRIYKTESEGYYRHRQLKAGSNGPTYAICNFCPVRITIIFH